MADGIEEDSKLSAQHHEAPGLQGSGPNPAPHGLNLSLPQPRQRELATGASVPLLSRFWTSPWASTVHLW